MSSAYDELRLENQLCFSLSLASQLVTGLYRQRLEALGLTFSQYLVMLAIWEHHPSTMPMSELEHRLRLESSTLSPVSKRLEAAGLIQRRRDPADERRVLLHLTPEGLALRDAALSVREEVVARLPLTAEEIADMRSALQRLSRGLMQARPGGSGPAAGDYLTGG